MLTIGEAMALGFTLGYAVAVMLNRKPPVDKEAKIVARLVIDPKALGQINAAMVTAWLEERGLTWMPKGAVFDHKKVIK